MMEGHPFSDVRDRLFSIFAATLALPKIRVLGIAQEISENLVILLSIDEGTDV